MKGNKIIATLVVLAMVLSTLVVLDKLNINIVKEAGATTPGYDEWGNATRNLVYGVAYSSLTINTSEWNESADCYLYYPTYKSSGTGPNAVTFTWDGPFNVSGIAVYIDSADIGEETAPLYTSGLGITFNRSGMWIFDNNNHHKGNDTSTYAGYIWVNASENYTIDSVADFYYGDATQKTFSVETDGDGCNIAIMAPDNSTIYHEYRATHETQSLWTNATFTMAGDYIIRAYRDMDAQTGIYLYKDEKVGSIYQNYSIYYGSDYSGTFPAAPSTSAEYYNYTHVGPWDPPEKNATEQTFTVNTGKPTITLTNTTIYWGFRTIIDINVTDYNGNGINVAKTAIKLKIGSTWLTAADGLYINNTGNGNYTLYFPRWQDGTPGNWSVLPESANTTWRIYFGYDANSDGTEEWNNSASATCRRSPSTVQLVIDNDGSGRTTDKKVNIPSYVYPYGYAPTVNITFTIYGTSIVDEDGRAYYGDDGPEDYKNITIAGDVLYPLNSRTGLTSGNSVLAYQSGGTWIAKVTPTQPGGEIVISIDWPGSENGSASQTIEIVNGTYATASTPTFKVGVHYNLTVTVKDMDGDFVKNANVSLMWEDSNTQFNSTNGDNTAGNGLNGEYTFWVNPDDADYPTTAPQNISVAAKWYTGFWGYTKVVLERDHNMMVNATPTMSYAGDMTTYDITISLVDGGNPKASGLVVALYNSTGDLVTYADDAWSISGDYTITDVDKALSGGYYYLYAHNDTHDSQGYNASLTITNYSVACSPSVLAWKVDQETNISFQITPAGNGTLSLENVSSTPNGSSVGDIYDVTIENGVGTIEEFNATNLGNVTFQYTPDGGEERPAEGLLRITTATATPDPANIYLGESANVVITVIHPASMAPIPGVWVNLTGTPLGTAVPQGGQTDADGMITFGLTPTGSGNITITMENETDPDNPFVIVAAARKLMTLTVDPSVNEGATFTIEAKSNGILITDATVTFTFAGQTWPTTTGTATITAPSVGASLTYPITATAEGYTPKEASITVLNVPELLIVVSGEVKAGQAFNVVIADDAGGPVVGATVTFEGKTYMSGASGVVSLTAPAAEGSYPISATFTGFTAASGTVTVTAGGGIPGFELLTLVAAIGVAFLLLRRRRN